MALCSGVPGCAGPTGGPLDWVDRVDAGPADRAPDPVVFDAAARTLTELGYVLDRRDPRSGVLTTRPQTIPAWRDTATWSPAGADSVFQGLSSGLRRTVTLVLAPDPDRAATGPGPDWEIRVETFRRRDARLQVTHTARRNRLRRMDAFPDEYAPTQRAAWVSAGRDARAEADLRQRIERRVDRMMAASNGH